MTTITRETSITEAQAKLSQLDQEEASIPAQLESKEAELDQAQSRGDFQLAATLSAEINYMAGPNGESAQRERIQRDRQATRRDLWDALAAEVDKQTADFETKATAQEAKEEEALAPIREASGCDWQPKVDLVTVQGLLRHIPQKPISQTLKETAKYRRDLSALLRSPDPDRFKNTTREALKLIPSPENPE